VILRLILIFTGCDDVTVYATFTCNIVKRISILQCDFDFFEDLIKFKKSVQRKIKKYF